MKQIALILLTVVGLMQASGLYANSIVMDGPNAACEKASAPNPELITCGTSAVNGKCPQGEDKLDPPPVIPKYWLHITVTGDGTLSPYNSDIQIAANTVLSFTPKAGANSSFTGWGGICPTEGKAPTDPTGCNFKMPSSEASLNAAFMPNITTGGGNSGVGTGGGNSGNGTSTGSCQISNGSCTSSPDCCSGLTCSSGYCKIPVNICKAAAQTCKSTGDCCSGLTCSPAGTCQLPIINNNNQCVPFGQGCRNSNGEAYKCCSGTCGIINGKCS